MLFRSMDVLWATIGRTPDRRTVACTAMPVNPRTLSRLKHGTIPPDKTGVLRRRAAPPLPEGQKTGSHPARVSRATCRRTMAAGCSAGHATAVIVDHWDHKRNVTAARRDRSNTSATAAHRGHNTDAPVAHRGHSTSVPQGHSSLALPARRASPAEGSHPPDKAPRRVLLAACATMTRPNQA